MVRFAVTLVPALLLVGVLPFLVRSLQEALNWRELAISPGWRLPLLLAVIYLLRNSVLRAREHHADLTAAAGGQVGKLDAVLSRLRAPRGGRLGGALSYHPSPERRRAVIADPRLVGRASPWLLLVAALLVGGGLRLAHLLFEALVAETPAAGWPLPLIALSTPLGGLVGLVVWRETAAYGRPPGVARSAVLGGAAGAGVALGNGLAVTTSDSFVGDTNLPWQTNLLGAAAMVVTILVMIVLVCWSGCCASILLGLTWLDRPRRFVTLGALLAAGVCGWSLPPAIELAQQARAIEWGGTAIVVLDQIGGYRAWLEDTLFTVAHDLVLTTSVLIALWAVPLAVAVLRSRRPGALPNADYAGAAAAARRALLCGVAGSVGVLAELLVVPHGGSHWWLTRRSVALAIVVLTGCIAVGLSRRQRLLAGWAAASVCGVGTILAGLMSALIHGTDITVQNFIYPLWAVTNTGTLAALPVVVLAVAVAVVEAVAGARRRA